MLKFVNRASLARICLHDSNLASLARHAHERNWILVRELRIPLIKFWDSLFENPQMNNKTNNKQ